MLLVRSLTFALEALRSSSLPLRDCLVTNVSYIRGERIVLSSQPAKYFLGHRPRVIESRKMDKGVGWGGGTFNNVQRSFKDA